MNSSSAKITYLVHSGFSVETAEHFLLFDYCPSMVREPSITDEFLKTKSNVYVFISHSHSDHFDPAVLQWARINPKINYIISSDVPIKNTFRQAHILSAYEAWEEPTLKVKAFGSTDAGISFLVQTDGLSVFHAGDLNWWHWKGETAEEQAYAEKNFKAEIAKLSGQKIDIAFFPVDRRLEEYYSIGAEYFAAKLHPRLLIPMHFARDFAATKAFAAKAAKIPATTVEITHKGQEIFFP